MSSRPRALVALLLTSLLVTSLYGLLHEGAHALVVLLCGGRVTAFNPGLLGAGGRVQFAGHLSRAQAAVGAVAGTAAPVLLWAAGTLAAPRRANPLLEIAKVVSALGVLSTLLPWVILPLLGLGRALPGDDVTAFLLASGASPRLVAALAGLACAAGWGLFLRRVESLRREVDVLAGLEGLDGSGARRTALAMLMVGAAALLAVVVIRAGLAVMV